MAESTISSFSDLSDSTKAVVVILGTCAVGWVIINIGRLIIFVYNALSVFFTPSEVDKLAAKRAAAAGKKAKPQANSKGHKQDNTNNKQTENKADNGTHVKQEAHQPGISLKTLMKTQKAKPSINLAADKATHHHLYVTTLKGHGDAVNGLAFDAASSTLATACEDRVVRLYRCSDLASGNVTFRHKQLLKGLQDVAFGREDGSLAILTKGTVDVGALSMYNLSGGSVEELWEVPDVVKKQAALVLYGSHEGPLTFLAASPGSVLTVVSGQGKVLAHVDTNGLKNHGAALSSNGRFAAAATFTADIKINEIKMDKGGAFQGAPKVMELKAHKSQVLAVSFSPCSRKAVSCSKDGTWRVWNIDVRYHMDEDPKCLITADLPLNKGQCFSLMAYGPNDVVAAVHQSSLYFLDARTGKLIDRVDAAHLDSITCLEWSRQRVPISSNSSVHVLATGGLDRRVRLWRAPR